MRIQILRTGQIFTTDTWRDIPNGEQCLILPKEDVRADSKIFRMDSNHIVAESPEVVDPFDKILEDSRQAQMDRICSNGGRYKSKQIDLTKLNTDSLDGVIEASRELQRQRISNNWKSR